MITIDNTEVSGFETAIRGMRNPLNSWDKSDSMNVSEWAYTSHLIGGYLVGEDDLELMKKLIKAGSDHSKFMRMIVVSCDIVAPLYWWKEMDTYKIGTVRNSCSTMHTIHKKRFELDDFSHEHLGALAIDLLAHTVAFLNTCRDEYKKGALGALNEITGFECASQKDVWWQIIQLLPSSYNQRATWQANYAVLRSIYHARKNHKLTEWHDFCRWVEGLPYSELITEVRRLAEQQEGQE